MDHDTTKNQTLSKLICKLLHSFIENSKAIFGLAGTPFTYKKYYYTNVYN